MREINGGEWFRDDRYVRHTHRQVALAHCQDAEIADQIVTDHNAAAEVERLRSQLRIASEALAFIYQYHNLQQAWIVADDALTQMSLVE
jgi:hypothetical protein